MVSDALKEDLLSFWFGTSILDDFPRNRDMWWQKDSEFDQLLRDTYSSLHDQAAQGALDHWQETPLGCLCLILLLDQFPRNMFRDTPRAFATDPKALEVTFHALEQGFDAGLPETARLFLYLPLEHSEDIDNQNACISLMQNFQSSNFVNFAERHRAIIRRFGRFPHRNAILGRPSTPEEITFLEQPNSGF